LNYWVIIYRFAWGVLLVLVTIGLLGVFMPKCNRLKELQRRKAALLEENRRTDTRTKELRLKEERFASDAKFVERTARETGMVKPDETVFKFSEEEP